MSFLVRAVAERCGDGNKSRQKDADLRTQWNLERGSGHVHHGRNSTSYFIPYSFLSIQPHFITPLTSRYTDMDSMAAVGPNIPSRCRVQSKASQSSEGATQFISNS